MSRSMLTAIHFVHADTCVADVRLLRTLQEHALGLWFGRDKSLLWRRGRSGALELAGARTMEDAQVVFVLLSPDFLKRKAAREQVVRALEQRARGAVVLPVVLRPKTDLSGLPLEGVTVLPRDGAAVTQRRAPEEAWTEIRAELQRALAEVSPLLRRFELDRGMVLDGCRIRGFSSRGVYRDIYDAELVPSGLPVVVKVGPPTAEARQSTRREVAALTVMRHPGLADVYGAGTLPDGSPYIIEEQIPGDHLGAACPTRDTMRGALGLVREVAETMSELHARGVVHGDLGAPKIQIDFRSPGKLWPGRARLYNLTSAHFIGEAAPPAEPEEELVLAAASHMAPELLSRGEISEKMDVRSLGVTLLGLCVSPYGVGSPYLFDQVRAITEGPAPTIHDPQGMVPIPRSVVSLVNAMVANDPAERPTMAEVVRVLNTV
jgi:hypothetical protein